MAVRLSRRKIASYYADELLAGRKDVATRLAAYLIDARRQRELQLIVRDIQAALAERGVLVAEVATSRKLTDEARTAVTAFLKASQSVKDVRLEESVDPELLGGVRISVPGAELDGTLRRKLTLLKSTKV